MDIGAVSGTSQLTAAACLLAAVHVYRHGVPPAQNVLQILATIGAGAIPFAFASAWLKQVARTVPEPYLDEVFHIPQAQVYCEGRYYDWDDKITTPPGLYLLSLWLIRGKTCSAANLRMVNVGIVSGIALVSATCKTLKQRHGFSRVSHNAMWTGTNIALFPVIFFFSGLYYTDAASTLVVLLAYWNHLSRCQETSPSLISSFTTILLGLSSLLMRQTNIFWVVVYMGGLEAVNAVKDLRPTSVKIPPSDSILEQAKFYAWRYSLGDIHDPSLDMTSPIVDVFLCAISLLIAGVCNIGTVLRWLWPHITVLATFVGFVVWNGGVVLGDKSNHVATLHLAQMLYIWPLFVFFSAPVFIWPVLQLASKAWFIIGNNTVADRFNAQKKQKKTSHNPSIISRFATSHIAQAMVVLVAALGEAALIVRFNTIIHPFTLADNRHYMFYVFRYSILRAWWIRYALVPIYIICAWLCWLALQGLGSKGRTSTATPGQHKRSWICSPWAKRATSPSHEDAKSKEGHKLQPVSHDSDTEEEAPSTSTVLILLIATTLSLMTAPLVEPRYFILPWVFWRLLVPTWPCCSSSPASNNDHKRPGGENSSVIVTRWWLTITTQFALEMVWFSIINIATMYIFLTRPFYWREQDGSLADDGRVQRFMW